MKILRTTCNIVLTCGSPRGGAADPTIGPTCSLSLWLDAMCRGQHLDAPGAFKLGSVDPKTCPFGSLLSPICFALESHA